MGDELTKKEYVDSTTERMVADIIHSAGSSMLTCRNVGINIVEETTALLTTNAQKYHKTIHPIT